MAGLPGDFTSPSRFVRAVAFANSALPEADADASVFQAFHILNAFDIPKEAIREGEGNALVTDYTFWTSAADLANATNCYKTYVGQAVEAVDIRKALEGLSAPATIEMDGEFVIRDRTGNF